MTNSFKIIEAIKEAERAFTKEEASLSSDFLNFYPLIQRLVVNENLAAIGSAENRSGWRVRLHYARQILSNELFDRQRAKMKEQELVFLTPSTGRRFEGDDGWYDATVEAIASDDPNRCSFCYEVPAFGTYRGPKARRSLYLGIPEIGFRFLNYFHTAKHQVPSGLLTDIARFKSFLESQGLQVRSLEASAFSRAHTYLHNRSKSFEKQLLRMQCRAVFTYPWYGQINMALMLAANRLGLCTVDCQHGVQGPMHAAYSDWPAFCVDSQLFPKHFFVWRGTDKTWLETWIGPKRSAHVIGIPWHDISQDTIAQDPHYQVYEKALFQNTRDGVILVSLQPNRPDFIDWLVRVLEEPSARNYTWVIRNHPGNQSEQSSLEEKFSSVEMVLPFGVSSKAPLISQLRDCNLHITDYSSVVTEASLMGVHSLMLTQNEELFSQERILGLAHSIPLNAEFWTDVEKYINLKKKLPVDGAGSSVHSALTSIL